MNTNDVTVVSNQHAGSVVPTQTPLHHAQLNGVIHTEASSNDAGVQLSERELTGHIVLRIRGDLAAASKAIEPVLGIGLPDTLKVTGNPASSTGPSLAWISPDEWRLMCPIDQAFENEQKLRDALSSVGASAGSSAGLSHALVNVSGGASVLDMSGPDALNVLKKSTGYDLRDKNFPLGKVVGTTFGKTTVQLMRSGEEDWHIIVRRSFADYLWLWIQNAAREYGLKI